jgi:hypothetical protein
MAKDVAAAVLALAREEEARAVQQTLFRLTVSGEPAATGGAPKGITPTLRRIPNGQTRTPIQHRR